MITAYEKIIPPDTVSELIAIGQSVTQNAWRIGDITNDCIYLNQLAGNDITKQTIYQAVGAFVGRASRTVRFYAEVSEFYPKTIRQQFEVLSFDHFRFAMKFNHWSEILSYATNNMDDRGRPASVDHLIAVFSYPEQEQEDNNILELVANLRKAVYKIPMPGDIRRLVIDALQRIVEAVEMVKTNG